MISYTASQAAMLAPQRIRVNGIAPGSIEFPGGVWDRRKQAGDKLYDRVRGSIAFGRMGTPEELAETVAWLMSPRASLVHGHALVADGGLTVA